MAKYEKYAEYQDSGVEWLGEIPSHWNVGNLKFSFVGIKNGSTETQIEESINTVPISRIESISTGEINYEKVGFVNKYSIAESYRIVEGDILLSHINSLSMVGNVAFKKDSSILYHGMNLLRLMPNKDRFDPKYLFWILKSKYFRNSVESIAKPAINQASVSIDALKNISLLIPTKIEQKNVANFLDHETSQIDTLIAKQETLIELLKEKRQAVISHAVTKGLNPNVKMKDSGVEWLGQVPEHWDVGRLKNVLTIKNGRDYKSVEVEEGGYPVYGSGGIFKRSSDYLYDGISILFGRKGTIDKPLLVKGRFWTVDTMFYSELAKNVCPEYVYFQSLGFPFDKLSTNTALPSMTQEDLLNLGFSIPPIEEQIAVSKFIEEYLEKNHSLMEKAKSAIQLMQERRTSLISSAVTGKIDVRHHASRPSGNDKKQMEDI